MRALADNLDDMTPTDLASELQATVAFLDGTLLPHAVEEEARLYPVVGRALGSANAVATMSREHLEIARLASQVSYLTNRSAGHASRRLRRDVRRTLYALEAIAMLHLDKEEEIFFPALVGALNDQEAGELLAALHH